MNDEGSNEFEEIDFSAPLNIRFVIFGLFMMIGSLLTAVSTEIIWAKYLAFFCFLASFIVMTKQMKKK